MISAGKWLAPRYIGDGKYEPRTYVPGDRLQNPRFVNKPAYHEKFVVEEIRGEYVVTRNEYSGTLGVMPASFYDGWPIVPAERVDGFSHTAESE